MQHTLEDVAAVYYGEGEQNKAKTAKILGLARSTVVDSLTRYDMLKASGELEKKAEPEFKRRNRELERLVKEQQSRIDKMSAAQVKVPKPVKRKPATDSFIRLIIPDVHGSAVDWDAFNAMLSDAKDLNPREVVIGGDFIDVGGFLAQHHVMGYVAQTSYTFEEDIATANKLLDLLQEACPNADVHYLYGNHEDRIEKWICTQTLRNPKDAAYLAKLFSVENQLHLDTRGFKVYRRSEHYDNLPIPGTIKLGLCHFTHGVSTSENAASAHVKTFAGNVVYFHTHRQDSASIRTVKDGLVSAWNPGCLCKLQPMWCAPRLTGWGHGFGVQICQPSGEFLHINVPVINGRSYLMDLTEKLNGKTKTNTANKKRT